MVRIISDAQGECPREGTNRGTLAVSREAPVGFRDIRLRFDLDTDAPADKVESLIKLTERYCVVYQTLRTPAKLALSMKASP